MTERTMQNVLMLAVLLAGSAGWAHAQKLPSWGEPMPMEAPADPGGDVYGPPLFPDVPDAVPIDGGLGLLGAAGVAYALNRLRKRREGVGD